MIEDLLTEIIFWWCSRKKT